MRSMLCVVPLLSLLCAPPAAAHAILLDSQPSLGGTIAVGDAHVLLRFNSRIDAHRSQLRLQRPDGSEAVLDIAPGSPADGLAATARLAAGAYALRWQVLAADGHITRGEVAFTVSPGAGR